MNEILVTRYERIIWEVVLFGEFMPDYKVSVFLAILNEQTDSPEKDAAIQRVLSECDISFTRND